MFTRHPAATVFVCLAAGALIVIVEAIATAQSRVTMPHYVPETTYNAASLCDMHEDLRDRMQPVLRTIAVETAGTRFDVAAVQAAHARATAILLEWKSLEYWMADARVADPRFQCYGWVFTPVDDDAAAAPPR